MAEMCDEGEEEADFDLFESGTIWTQVISTQMQCEAWQRGDNPRTDDLEVGTEEIMDNTLPERAESELPLNDRALPCIDLDELDDADDEVARQPSRSPVAVDETTAQPWWKKGKTAPLLNQYDESRRMWYLAQAGVFDQSKSVHDAQGQVDALQAAATSLAAQNGGTPRGLNATAAVATPIRAGGAVPQRAALTLAGNVNSPLACRGLGALQQTPKRKTWSSTMAQRQEQESAKRTPDSAASSAKKRRKAGKSKPFSSTGPGRPRQHSTPSRAVRN